MSPIATTHVCAVANPTLAHGQDGIDGRAVRLAQAEGYVSTGP